MPTKPLPYTVTIQPAGPYTFGQEITTVTDAPQDPDTWIGLVGHQGGVVVITGTHAGWPDGWYFDQPWQLGPTQSWISGPCDITVTVVKHVHNKDQILAQTTFHVDG